MQIFVRTGLNTAPMAVNLPAEGTVRDLQLAVEDKTFLPVGVQRIVGPNSEALPTSSVLSHFLVDGDEVVLEVPIDAGMRAKWRKKRMRRLRRKRRKMRMRAR